MRRRLLVALWVAVGWLLAAGCSAGARPGGGGPGTGGNGDAPDLAAGGAPDAGASDAGTPDLAPPGPAVCVDGAAVCSAWNVRAVCVGGAWVETTCPAGCSAGQCSATACADECALGATSAMGTCRLWDVGQGRFVDADPATRLHDRARDYDRLLRAHQLVNGGVCNAVYTDATRAQLAYYSGTGDAALWTGTALAAQAWRYRATGAPDAAAEMARLAATLHLFFTVSGEPAYLARLALPSDDPTPLEYTNRCANGDWHCGVDHAGTRYDWYGHISRDAYTGVLLGDWAAWSATADPSLRATIRDDVVTLATELMKPRQVPATVTVNGVSFPTTLSLENVILSPSEMTDGRVTITVGGSNELYGAREFLPDFGVVLQQIVGASPPVPRPSSAIMLGAFFEEALAMTDGVPGYEAVHQQLADYYAAHADGWLSIAEQWSFSANCGNAYYANHIAFIMAYVYALLETDPARGPRIRDGVLDGRMWAALGSQKNPYFAYLWGATRPSPPDAATIAAANAELVQFPAGPRVHVAVDHSNDPKYPHDATCTSEPTADTATSAIDVGDRVVEDFLWQRSPWRLVDAGNPAEVFPGVDFLAAYWAARAHGFVADDAGGTCARWAP